MCKHTVQYIGRSESHQYHLSKSHSISAGKTTILKSSKIVLRSIWKVTVSWSIFYSIFLIYFSSLSSVLSPVDFVPCVSTPVITCVPPVNLCSSSPSDCLCSFLVFCLCVWILPQTRLLCLPYLCLAVFGPLSTIRIKRLFYRLRFIPLCAFWSTSLSHYRGIIIVPLYTITMEIK